MLFRDPKRLFRFRRTIQFDLMIVLVVIAILPVFLVNQFYSQWMRSFIEEKVTVYHEELVKQTAKQLGAIVSQTDIAKEQITAYLISPAIEITSAEPSPVEKVRMVHETEVYLANVRRSFPAITAIYVFLSDGRFFASNPIVNRELLLARPWLDPGNRPGNGDFIVTKHNADYTNVNNRLQAPAMMSFIREVVIYGGKTRPSATIQIDVDYAQIEAIIAGMSLGEEAAVVVTDARGQSIYCLQQDCFERPSPEELTSQKIYTVQQAVSDSDWIITASIPNTVLYNQLGAVNNSAIAITFMAVIFAVVASYVISSSFASPIRKLVKGMEKVGKGIFEDVSITSHNAEIQTLVHSFNAMAQRIVSLMTSNIEKEKEMTSAQFKALEAQINPHFLYNTLETIRSIARQNNIESIAEICKSLADMFRYSISRGGDFVTLGEEIHHIRNYMNVQKYRYGDKIVFECLVDDDLLAYYTIKLILQPIVENAIFHGLETKRGQGRILLSAYQEQDSIYLNIVDDGPGIEADKVAQLNAVFAGQLKGEVLHLGTRGGIGLLNVDSRIKLNFGNAFGLWVSSVPGQETQIRVHIPSVRESARIARV